MIPQQLDHKFNAIRPYLEELKRHVADTLAGFVDANNFPITGRIKTPDSISEKIEMGRHGCFSELEDLVAFTLIIPNATYESSVCDFCKAKFRIIEIRNKLTAKKAPDQFRFDSTRIVACAHRRPDIDPTIP